MKTKTTVIAVIVLAAILAIAIGVGVGVHNRHSRQIESNGISASETAPRLNCTININSTSSVWGSAQLSNVSAAFATSNLTFLGTQFTVFAPTDAAFTNLTARLGTTQAASNETIQALLAYHIVPGLYGASQDAEEELPAASRTTATELATLLALPTNVTVAESANKIVANVTDDLGNTLVTSYITRRSLSTCNWVMYSIDNFLIPAVLMKDTNQTVAAQVATKLQQGPVAATTSIAQNSSQSPPAPAGTINS